MTDSTKLPVTVIVTTYDPSDNSRFNLLYQTVQSLVDNLIYPNLRWTITDDGSPNHYDMVREVSKIIPGDDVIFYDTGRRGVGYAKNNALKEAFSVSKLCWLTEDDWWISEPLNLLPHVQLMLDHPEIGFIRFGFLGGSLSADYIDYGYPLTYWKLKPTSGLYCYSGQCGLRSSCLYEKVGWHDETTSPGEEELNYCWRYNQTVSPPDILWPAQYGCTLNAGIVKNIGLSPEVSVNSIKPGS